MANTTVTTAANFIPEIWSKEVIKAAEANLVLANLVWRFDSDVKSAGDTVHVPNLSDFTAQDKVAGVSTSPQANTESKVDISIDTHKEITFLLEDIVKIQSSYDLMSKFTGKAGYGIAKAVDSAIAALATGFTQTTGTYATAITTDAVLGAIEYLDLADAPQSDRFFAFRPDVKRDLLDIDRYVSVDFVAQPGVKTGMIGELYGVPTFMSTNMYKTASNTSNIMAHKDAIALAMQSSPRTQSEYSLADLAYRVTVDTIFGVKEMRDAFGVEVKS
jgi:N4-gp56 family major capsid protein